MFAKRNIRMAVLAALWSVTGAVQAVDSYKPSPAMRAFLQARDIHCRFIGCRQAAVTCELDHTKDYQYGGKTAVWNLSDFANTTTSSNTTPPGK